jgi:signal transduction histidine kinase
MRGRRFKTLLVEDNPGEARLLLELLRGETGTGDLFDVECTERMATAILRLGVGDIDVVLLDLSLPDSQGEETFARVKSCAPDIAIVVLSGLNDEGIALKIVKGGAQDYLPKEHINAPLLARTIRYAIERKRVEQEIRLLNGNLEQRVIERTEQLIAANGELRTQIAERDRIQQALDGKNIELQNAARAKDRFLANMSHELRTPLNGIIGFTEFLVDGKPGALNSKQKNYLEDILNSGRHLLQLINDVLDLAKVEAGKMELKARRFSLRQSIEEVCAVTKLIAQKKGIRVGVYVAPELGEITLDQSKFKQVLYNLLSNALKFTDQGGEVELSAESENPHRFKLVVKDSGIGIKGADVGRLFKEFEQLESETTPQQEGTGLGLALTRRIVELQGGTITVESEVGKGSTFTVLLPLIMVEAEV